MIHFHECEAAAGRQSMHANNKHVRVSGHTFHSLIACLLALSTLAVPASDRIDERIELRVDTSEAEAVLLILGKHESGQTIDETDWHRLFDSEPYRRLKARERAMQRSFTEDDFRQFVLSAEMRGRAAELRRTLDAWKMQDLRASAHRVLFYLPSEARFRATIYPVIKPQTNSFVFDVQGDPAIFLYLDPEQSPAKFENTVAHELHHIGFASVPTSNPGAGEGSDGVEDAVEWMGAFGEGFAMLAAAGGLDTHPHAVSPPGERARWDRDMTAFNEQLASLEDFFMDIIEGRLATDDEIRERGFSFFGVQGPWYTVGYRMAAIIERRYGRPELIECMADPRRMIARYNSAAAEMNAAGGSEEFALWSPRLLEALGRGQEEPGG
jgi:Putative zinc dependent peptidase (DUF5700)